MIFSENRYPLFRIMLWHSPQSRRTTQNTTQTAPKAKITRPVLTLASHTDGSAGRAAPSDAKEHVPDACKSEEGKAKADDQQRKNRRAGFGLTRLYWRLDDLVGVLPCHQIFGARSARSNTGVFSTSSGVAPEGVSSAACRNASVEASRPSSVSLAALPESCGRAGTRLPPSVPGSSTGFLRAMVCLPRGRDTNVPGSCRFRS